jgi:hypothetical protein
MDPYNHLRSIHNCLAFYDHTKPWVTHCSIQSSHLDRVPLWLKKYGKPVVVDECCYEGNIHKMWGDLSPEEMVLRFWVGFTLGYWGMEPIKSGKVLYGQRVVSCMVKRCHRISSQDSAGSTAGLTGMEYDNETINLLDGKLSQYIRSQNGDEERIVAEGPGMLKRSFCGEYHVLFWQPGSRNFNYCRLLPRDTKHQKYDVIFAENASGSIQVRARQKYIAVASSAMHACLPNTC